MCYEEGHKLPLIGEKAPSFKAETTQGPINFPQDYAGKWVIFFSHPADYSLCYRPRAVILVHFGAESSSEVF